MNDHDSRHPSALVAERAPGNLVPNRRSPRLHFVTGE